MLELEQAIIIFALLLVAIFDIKKREVPHTSILLILGLGIYMHWQEPIFLLGGIFGILAFFLLFSAGLGAGDIKLFSAMGGVLGLHACLIFAIYVFVFTLIIVLVYRAVKDTLGATFQQIKMFLLSLATRTVKNYLLDKKQIDSIPLGAFFLPAYLIYEGVQNGVF